MTKVFEPMAFKRMKIANRVGVAPMCTYMCLKKDGTAEDFHLTHYTTFAMGHPGFIIQEATSVNESGYISDYCLGIHQPRQREALKRVIDSVHGYPVKFGIQLNHAGAKSMKAGCRKISASALVEGVEEATLADINKVVSDFESAAKWARQLGYDFVEVHSAHGYLINQFLSPLTNKRTDAYGKDKGLLLQQVVEAVLKEFEGPVFVRLSGDEYAEGGRHIEDTMETVKRLDRLGVSLINMSSGGVASVAMNLYPMYQVHLATQAKTVTGLPLATAGLITEREQIADIIDNEKADVVLLGRLITRDPFFLMKWMYDLGLITKENTPNYLYRSLSAMK